MESVKIQFSISAVRVNGDNKRVIKNKKVDTVEELTGIFKSWVQENQTKNDIMFKVRTVSSSDIKPRGKPSPLPPPDVTNPEQYVKNLIRDCWERLPEKHRHYAYIVRRLSNQWTLYVEWNTFYNLYQEVATELGSGGKE